MARAPIKLASWDHIAEICRRVAPSLHDWNFFKAAHEAAYKKLPLRRGRSSSAVVAISNPKGGRRYGLRIREMLFGAVAAELRYNAPSRTLADLFARLFGIPF